MNYRLIMNEIIEQARGRVLECYTERHHIIPTCMGGTDDADNLVDLTAREHYIVHQLLVKMYPNHLGIIKAAVMMTVGSERHKRVNNRLYEWLKKKHAESMSNRIVSEETRRRNGDAHRGSKRTEKTKKQMSVSAKNRKLATAETCRAISEAKLGQKYNVKSKQIKLTHIRKKNFTTKGLNTLRDLGYKLSQNKEARLKAAETKAANWIITDPEGKTIQIKNLRKYCRDNNLPFQSVH